MNKKEKLINIFKQLQIKDSEYRRRALNFKIKRSNNGGLEFEENLKAIFDENEITYKYQPRGSQDFPDFVITLTTSFFSICLVFSSTLFTFSSIVFSSIFPSINISSSPEAFLGITKSLIKKK